MDIRESAQRRFEEALATTGARDPRDFYRKRLRELKESDPLAYRSATEYFEETLIPRVAGEADPIAEWTEYGRFLAERVSPGQTVRIDTSGRSWEYSPPASPDDLILQLPHASGSPSLLVGLPRELSPAQQASYALLVTGARAQNP